jgi:hypothetical protein
MRSWETIALYRGFVPRYSGRWERVVLPIYANYHDITLVVDYLKTKATGVELSEAKKVVPTKHLDGRKLAAMETWGLISKGGGKMRLTTEGRNFASMDQSQRSKFLWSIIGGNNLYRTTMEWLYHQKKNSVTNVDVAAHWHEFNKSEVGEAVESTLKDAVVCMFNLADAAGMGTMTVGRRGKPTRFDATMDAIEEFIKSSSPSALPPEERAQVPEGVVVQKKEGIEVTAHPPPSIERPKKIFVAHGKNREPLESIKRILGQFQIPYVVAVEEASVGRPISKKVADLIKECTSAIFIFTRDEESMDSGGKKIWKPSDNVVYELGAATVLYDGKVVVLKEEGVDFASDFRDFGYITFESGKIDAKAMDLIKELVGFGLLRVTPA